MIDHGLTYYVEYTGSCQCMECDLAIHSLIHRIQRESKAKCFILFLSYINCYVATFEGCINSVKSVHFCFENTLFSGKICRRSPKTPLVSGVAYIVWKKLYTCRLNYQAISLSKSDWIGPLFLKSNLLPVGLKIQKEKKQLYLSLRKGNMPMTDWVKERSFKE